jgi:hypothetical protein
MKRNRAAPLYEQALILYTGDRQAGVGLRRRAA